MEKKAIKRQSVLIDATALATAPLFADVGLLAVAGQVAVVPVFVRVKVLTKPASLGIVTPLSVDMSIGDEKLK